MADELKKLPDICPVGAQRLEQAPGRSVRNQVYTELGSIKLPEGNVRAFANRRDGSLLIVMPDQSGFLLDTNVVATQCYKYWKLHPGEIVSDEDMPDIDVGDESVGGKILRMDGQPLQA